MLVEKLRFYFSKPLLNSPVGPFLREFLYLSSNFYRTRDSLMGI
jgi:hypothetical protein